MLYQVSKNCSDSKRTVPEHKYEVLRKLLVLVSQTDTPDCHKALTLNNFCTDFLTKKSVNVSFVKLN